MTKTILYDFLSVTGGHIGIVFEEDLSVILLFLPGMSEQKMLEEVRRLLRTSSQDFKIKKRSHPKKELFNRYFSGKKVKLNTIKTNLDFFSPSEFQKKVWDECSNIGYSETISYKELSDRIGTKAFRAVGTALGKNPIPLIIPCHRVIGKTSLGGFSGAGGTAMKKRLLELEGHQYSNSTKRQNI